MDFLWGLDQHQGNRDLELSLARADKRADNLELRCAELEEQMSNLRFFIQALVDLTWDQFDLSEDQLQSRIRELKEEKKREEAEEASRTIKTKRIAFACSNCGQPVAMTSKVCFYCGKPAEPPKEDNEHDRT